MTMSLISTVTVTSPTYFIQFLNIPQSGTDLYILMSGREQTTAQISTAFSIGFSGGGTATKRQLTGTGTAVNSSTVFNAFYTANNGGSSTASTFNNAMAYVPNYTLSGDKTILLDAVTENAAANANQVIAVQNYASSGPITSILIASSDNPFAVDTKVSLYVITKGSGGATVS